MADHGGTGWFLCSGCNGCYHFQDLLCNGRYAHADKDVDSDLHSIHSGKGIRILSLWIAGPRRGDERVSISESPDSSTTAGRLRDTKTRAASARQIAKEREPARDDQSNSP